MTWVTELSDAELRARLDQRGCPTGMVDALVADRDDPSTVRAIGELLD